MAEYGRNANEGRGLGWGWNNATSGNWNRLENFSQNTWNNITGKSSREAAKKAAEEAERSRRESIVRQMGARQQAESLAFYGLMRPSSGGGAKKDGVVGGNDAPGSIAANAASSNGISGTF
jgi:hypothetical protein